MTTFEIIRDLILLGLALFGAGLSVFNYVQAEKRDKRMVRITMGTAMPTYFDGSIGEAHAKIEATNIGHRPISLTSLYIELEGGARMVNMEADAFPGVPDTVLPMVLSDGQTAHRHWAYSDLAIALQSSGRNQKLKLTPVAEDSAGNIYRGEPWETQASELSSVAGRASA